MTLCIYTKPQGVIMKLTFNTFVNWKTSIVMSKVKILNYLFIYLFCFPFS